MTCIDVLSRYVWIVPLMSKTGKTLKDAFHVIFKSRRRPIRLQTDKVTEFTNRVFQMFLKEHDVHFFTTYNEEIKASIGERFNRTLKTQMWKYFTHRETLTYVDVLSEMVTSYSHTVHRTICIPPTEVTWANQTTVFKRLYGRKGPTKSCDSAKRSVRSRKDIYPTGLKNCLRSEMYRNQTPGILSQRRPR